MTNESMTMENTAAESTDKKLVFELIESMYAGIALMMQAQQKTVSPQIKKLAEKLEDEHTKLTEELKMYASDKSWIIPAGELEKDINAREKMAKLNGGEYEQQWLAALKDRHQTNLLKLENANPYDSKLQKMGEKGASKIKDLLSDIEDVQESII